MDVVESDFFCGCSMVLFGEIQPEKMVTSDASLTPSQPHKISSFDACTWWANLLVFSVN